MSKLLNEYDYEAIHAQAAELMKTRKHLKKSAIDRYMKYFDEKCAASKKETELAKQCIPGGIQHNLANNHPFTLAVNKAEGPYLYDIDGNRYIDFLCAGGPIILGNNYPAVRDAAVKQIMRAVMECICYSLRGQVELYRKDTGKDLKEVGANGGGSLSDPWMQMMADVLQMPVNIPDEPRHSGAIGAAFAAAVGLGWCGFQDVKQFVKTKKTFTPDPELAELYDKRYDTFMKFYESVKTLSYDINQEE